SLRVMASQRVASLAGRSEDHASFREQARWPWLAGTVGTGAGWKTKHSERQYTRGHSTSKVASAAIRRPPGRLERPNRHRLNVTAKPRSLSAVPTRRPRRGL